MAYEIEEIKDIRKSHHLTQSDLAKRSGVSQSLIAKIEAGRLDPTYTKVKKIFAALNELSKKKEAKAKDIMNKKVITIDPNDSIKDTIKKMRKYEISQMPVFKNHKSVGFISEKILLEAIIDEKHHKVKDVMSEPPPMISITTPANIISNLLQHFQIVLVSHDGELVGVITRSDLLRKLYK